MIERTATAAAMLLAALAPEAQGQDAAQALERIEIVGSHLKRVEAEGPAPVTIIGRDEIEASGAIRITELLVQLPYASAGGFDDRTAAFSLLQGAAAVSLRGLGPGATLVLLNGRRLVGYGIALDNDESFIDLNSLPLAAVDRIEILRDGASAIYGADAIAGVINIVLRRDYRGAEAAVRWARSTHGDADSKYATATIGFGDPGKDGYNAFVAVDRLRQDALPSTARAFSRSADQRAHGGGDFRSPRSFPPTVRIGGAAPMPAPGCPPERISTTPGVPGASCMFDPNPFTPLLPPVERTSALAVGNVDASARLRLFAELAASRSRSELAVSPTPIQFLLSAETPTNPFGADALLFWRPVDFGPRVSVTTIDFVRAVAGARGNVGRWDWEVAAGHNAIDTDYAWRNQIRASALESAVADGRIDPFTDRNDPAQLDAIRTGALDRYRTRMSFVQAKASAELLQLRHGPLALAVGAERRRERFAARLDPLIVAGEIAGAGVALTESTDGERDVSALFVELNWPAARGLELQLAARHDRYSDFGGNTSPKIALRWQPIRSVLVRASAGRGFLPPTLFQLNAPRSGFDAADADPVRCPVTQSPEDCLVFFFQSRQGNPAVRPERSRQYNVGVVLEPLPALAVALDFWRIEHSDKIVFGDRYILQHEALFPGAVVRGEPSAADVALGLPGPIVELRDTYINLARRDVRGVDLEVKYRSQPRGWGRVSLAAAATYLERFVETITPDSAPESRAGGDRRPRWKSELQLQWERGAWLVGLDSRYVGPYRYDIGDGTMRKVASWTVFDARLAWRGAKNQVTLQLQNVGDRPPPFRDTREGYDAQVHDPRGRMLSLKARHAF